MVDMGDEYMTPPEEENDHPFLKLMEYYTLELKNGDYLTKYGARRKASIARRFIPARNSRNS